MTGYLVDTNIISESLRPQPDANVAAWMESTEDALKYLSVATIGEIQKGIDLLADSARKERLHLWVRLDLRIQMGARILPITAEIAEMWGTLSARRQREGRPLSVVDGYLGATALVHGLTVVTRNTRDFEGLGVSVLNPFEA